MLFYVAVAIFFGCDYYDPINPNQNFKHVPPDVKIYIPDANFLKALIDRGIDKNGDGAISKNEANTVTVLYIIDENISDLTGIESFTNLEVLKCDRNPLKIFPIIKLNRLKHLSCQGIKFGLLVLWENPELKILECDNCQLNDIWLEGNPNLLELSCSYNNLTYIDLSNNAKLKMVRLNGMPNLGKVCVWEWPFPPTETVISTINSPNAYFSIDCY